MPAKKSMFGNSTRSVALLWGEKQRSSRGPKPALDIERIVRAGIKIADADGLAAVSMQRVAETFGFATMSLYRYLPSKTELIDLMIDTAAGGPPALDAVSEQWQPKLTEWARQLWAVFQRHGWLLGATVGHRVMGPNELGWMECAVRALANTNLDGGEMMDAVAVVAGHVRNIAQQTMTTPGGRRGTSERQMASALAALLRKHHHRYPALTAALASTSSVSRNKALDFGLQRIFDGLAILIAERSKKR